jgi:hypothetical protein
MIIFKMCGIYRQLIYFKLDSVSNRSTRPDTEHDGYLMHSELLS